MDYRNIGTHHIVGHLWTSRACADSPLLELIEEVLLIHEHILPAIGVRGGQDLCADAWQRAGLARDSAACRLDLLSALVHVLRT